MKSVQVSILDCYLKSRKGFDMDITKVIVEEFKKQWVAGGGKWNSKWDNMNPFEALEENIVYEGDRDSHRWYDAVETVSKVGDKYFEWTAYHTTGDLSWRDMGLERDVRDVREVERKERVITQVYYV